MNTQLNYYLDAERQADLRRSAHRVPLIRHARAFESTGVWSAMVARFYVRLRGIAQRRTRAHVEHHEATTGPSSSAV